VTKINVKNDKNKKKCKKNKNFSKVIRIKLEFLKKMFIFALLYNYALYCNGDIIVKTVTTIN